MKNRIQFYLALCIYLTAFNSSMSYQQPTKDISILLEQAKNSHDEFIAYLQSNASNHTILDGGIKPQCTIDRLLKSGQRKDASYITDFVRATIVVPTLIEVYDYLEQIRTSSWDIVGIEDHFLKPFPEGYSDIALILRDPNNQHLVELQINTQPIIYFKNKGGHFLFDCLRKIKAQLLIEKRSPTLEESIIINYLTQLSKDEYKRALDESLIYNNKQVRIGVYAIIQENGKSLLVETESKNRIIYNFPGGGVENNENFEQALVRECSEEIGCSVTIGEYYTSGIFQNPDYPENVMLNIYYKATLNEPIQDGIWADDCQELSMLSIDREIFNRLQ